MGSRTHGLTGAPLQQPDPAPLRVWAMYDRDKPCTEHSPAYQGKIPCTGPYQCNLCGTSWDDRGNVTGTVDPLRALRGQVHKAWPASGDPASSTGAGTHCRACSQWIRRVPGGQGPVWVHAATGAVAAAGHDPAEDEN